IDFAAARLLRSRHSLSPDELRELVERFVDQQDLTPAPAHGRRNAHGTTPPTRAVAAVLARMLRVVRDHREGL
ncbi:MAG: hypothetical protein IT386_06840, partial [Deltaproteobacteria bacterium]|nr:hypothetical protein [Deltaproteobacteria bacterium]